MDDELSQKVQDFFNAAKKGVKRGAGILLPIESAKRLHRTYRDLDHYETDVYQPFEDKRNTVHYALVDLMHVRNEVNCLSNRILYNEDGYFLPRFESKNDLEKVLEGLAYSIRTDKTFVAEKAAIRAELKSVYDAYFKPETFTRKRKINTKRIADKVNHAYSQLYELRETMDIEYAKLTREEEEYIGEFRKAGLLFGANIAATALLTYAGGALLSRLPGLGTVGPKLARALKAKSVVG